MVQVTIAVSVPVHRAAAIVEGTAPMVVEVDMEAVDTPALVEALVADSALEAAREVVVAMVVVVETYYEFLSSSFTGLGLGGCRQREHLLADGIADKFDEVPIAYGHPEAISIELANDWCLWWTVKPIYLREIDLLSIGGLLTTKEIIAVLRSLPALNRDGRRGTNDTHGTRGLKGDEEGVDLGPVEVSDTRYDEKKK